MSNSKRPSKPSANRDTATIRRLSDDNTVAKRSADGSKITRINDKLAVELLDKLLLFVDTRRHKNFKPNNSASLENVGAIVISRQFDLRYVCLLWHNIVHRLACLSLRYYSNDGNFLLLNDGLDGQLSKCRKDTVLLESSIVSDEKNRNGTWYTLVDRIQSLRVTVYNLNSSDKSILFALHNAAKSIDHPCDLCLNLTESGTDASGTVVRDPYADFHKLYPTLSLRHLSLDFSRFWGGEMTEAEASRANECAVYCLSIGKQTLRYVSVNLAALTALPEDWICDSLRDLYVDLDPQGFDDKTSNWSEERMLRQLNKQALIPRLFPQLEKLTLIAHHWPHVDFVSLSQLARLKTLVLSVWPIETTDQPIDWRPVTLPLIQSLSLRHDLIKLPMPLAEFVPNLIHLKVDIRSSKTGCNDVRCEIGASANGFAQLSDLSVNFPLFLHDESPPTTDVIALVTSLRQLPALKSFDLGICKTNSILWCRPADLALLHVLPPGINSVSMFYCLLPAAVAPGTDDVNFVYDPNVANAEELIYKTWFLMVIHRLSQFAKLERFYCKIIAPSFHAAVSLAAKWSKSSTAAIADLGLASIINVSCSTEAYLSIEPEQSYGRCDTLEYRFTLASRSECGKRKCSTRMFTFELEYPMEALLLL